MKFSYQWLASLTKGLQHEPRELAQLITMKTAESDGVVPFAPYLAQVCAARVLAVAPIPNSHNVQATVDTGRYGAKSVVCGAPNCRVGIVTAYVPPGTALGVLQIEAATIQGVTSEGMLASGAELGLNRDQTGVLELNAQPGDPLPGVRPDSIIEIDNKSLTHRPDLWGHYGMAREVAAITGARLLDPVKLDLLPAAPAPLKIDIADHALCARYSALVLENVTVAPSPLWLQARLEAVGLNPINNVVDVTNFVMAELPQPMHAFDADRLAGDTIFVRSGRSGEQLQALNSETYALDESALVIADAAGAIALAGVIGGAESAISAGTTRIVLESANFQAASVRKTSSRLKLRTDASMRFEKALDPENTTRGLARALELLQELSPGLRVKGGVADRYAQPPVAPPIPLSLSWTQRKLGTPVSAAQVSSILRSLEFGVATVDTDLLQVQVPSWRATKDVSLPDDLVEEIGRMIGYASIAPVAPAVPVRVPFVQPGRPYARYVRHLLADQGYHEVHNYSFLSEELARRFGLDPAQLVAVRNPIAADQNLLRTSLLPGMWRSIQSNSKQFDGFRLFELGHAIVPRSGTLPRETPRLAIAVYAKDDGLGSLRELQRVAAELVPEGRIVPTSETHVHEHPARTGVLTVRDVAVGRLTEFHPNFVSPGRAAVLDLDLALLERFGQTVQRYQPIRRTPASAFDLSILCPMRTLVGALLEQMRRSAGERLEDVAYLGEYSGPQVPTGQKSVSFRLTVADPTRTLSTDEVNAIRAEVIASLQRSGLDLRS